MTSPFSQSKTLSILWLGLIKLTGIVVNNAIVLVEQIEVERENGLELIEAIVEGARLRLRPILMTSLTTVVGMLPLATAKLPDKIDTELPIGQLT
ncbi:MAG: efflux RND transporter permease subunit [Gammaproteobacteria bacterium]